MFTKEELEKMYQRNLFRLAEYYGLRVYKSWSKSRIIEVILDYLSTSEEVEEVQMSVRVRRIYEANKEK